MAKDYYLILGIGPDATLEQIKSAYRQKAKRWHPDHCDEGSEPFLAIQEAYEVLSDAGRRRVYDAEMARGRSRPAQDSGPQRRYRSPVEAVEPLIPTHRPGSPGAPFPESSFSSLLDALWGPTPGRWDDLDRGMPGGGQDLYVQVPLTREQVLRGGRARLWVPVSVACPTCQGWGSIGLFECPRCGGRGTVAGEYPVDVAFPAGLGDGVQKRLRLRIAGMEDRWLTLHFRVPR